MNHNSKYKIYKFTDGNQNEWYQVKVKGWFFWNWLGNTCGGELPLFNPIEYKDIESAHDAIKDQETMRLSRQIKKIEIIDNKVNTGKDEMLISSDAIDRADKVVQKFSDYIYNRAFKNVKDEQRKRVEVADIDRVMFYGEYISRIADDLVRGLVNDTN
jgi:histone H3/H4